MFNRISLHGRFTANPELKITQSGTAVTSFYLAVDDGKKANFFKCVAWESKAANTYTDKNGIKRTDVFVVVREIDFCDKKNDEENQRDFETALNDVEQPLPFD